MKDEIKGTVHAVKGKVKETAGKVTNILTYRPKATPKKTPAKLRRRSDRSKKCSRNKYCRSVLQKPSGLSAWRSEFYIGAGLHVPGSRTDHFVAGTRPAVPFSA